MGRRLHHLLRLLDGPGRPACVHLRATDLRFASPHHAGHGLPSVEALRLLRRLLAWDPSARISAAEAAQHPFFTEETMN